MDAFALNLSRGRLPVIQLSIQPRQGPEHHFRLGQALAPLLHGGISIVGSGAATHNLGAFADDEAPPPNWVRAFDGWLAMTIHANDIASLLAYRTLAPYARQNHPSEEHLLPLFVALGAGGSGQRIHRGFTHRILSMAAFRFDGSPEGAG
ncbi:MAG: class III extradiol ring-cleavage dioxygenase [Cyanobacteria bacterium J06641_5]